LASTHDERLLFLDEVRGEFRPVVVADVLAPVDRSGRDEQDVAGLVVAAGSPSL
jgi:hypothetical protein